MDSRDLTYVLTVRDTQNFSKAAQRLFISQPSLSQYIRRLEQRLGEPIFFRDKAQVMLTPFGEVYAREAEKLLDCIHQMEETLHLAKERNRSMIRVGISQSYSKSFVPAIIKIVHKLRLIPTWRLSTGFPRSLKRKSLKGAFPSESFRDRRRAVMWLSFPSARIRSTLPYRGTTKKRSKS